MRSILPTILLLGVLAPTAAHADPAPARSVDGEASDWAGSSTGLGGTWQISEREFVYQDYVYDDYGADTNARASQHSTTRSSQTRGDLRYPADEGRYGNNSADIRELRLAADADDLYVLLALNTLKAADSTVLALAIDADDDATTGGGSWPHAAGIATPGAEYVVTLWGTGGDVTRLADGVTSVLTDVAADLDGNTIEASVPRDLLSGTDWAIRAATGIWDPSAQTWMAIGVLAPTTTAPGYGSANVAARAFNVAFRDRESGAYFDELQAAALAAGDLSAFVARVDIDDLVAGADVGYEPHTGRLYEVVLRQTFTIPPHHEGHGWTGVPGRSQGFGGAALAQAFTFYGQYQPYSVYVPASYDGTALPMALILHGHGGSHCGFNCTPNFLAQMGEAPDDPMLLVSPLGRGQSMYADYGELDVLEVLDDATARFAVDADRVYIAGYSMGGYGTLRLASLYPDRFAAAGSWAGYTGEFTGRYLYDQRHVGYPQEASDLWQQQIMPLSPLDGEGDRNPNGDLVESVDGLLHVPLVQLAGTNDEILPVTGQYAASRRLDALRYEHRFDLYPGYEHLTFGILDDWTVVREWFGRRTLERSPRRVAYRYSDAYNDPAFALDIEHGRAYWVTGTALRVSDTSKVSVLGRIDATSHALPGRITGPEEYAEPSLSPTPNLRTGVRTVPGAEEPLANRLDVTLENLASASVDASAAGLTPAEALTVQVRTDGPATIVLEGDFSALGPIAVPIGVVVEATAQALTIGVPGAGTFTVLTTPA